MKFYLAVGVVWLACWSLAEAQQQQQQRRRNGGFRPAFFDDDDDFGPREPFEDPAAPAVRRPVREPQQQRQVLRSGRPRQEAAVDFRPRQEPSDFRARPQAPPQAPPLPLVKSQKSKNRPAKRPLAALPQPAALQQQQPQAEPLVEAREEPEEPASFQREESRPVRAYPSGGAAKEIAPPAVADAGADVGEARDAAYADSFGRSAFETGVQTYSAGLNPEAGLPGQRLQFNIAGQQGIGSYRFGYDTGSGPNRVFRIEEKDGYGVVHGRYGYYDSYGKLRVVNYKADPALGFSAAGNFGPK